MGRPDRFPLRLEIRVPTLRLLTGTKSSTRHAGEVSTCSYAPNGQFVLSGGWDGFLRLWDGQLGASVNGLQVSDKPITACAVAPDGKHWLGGTLDGMLAKWDPTTGKQVSTFLAHPRPLSAIHFDAGGRKLLTASWDATLIIWDSKHDHPGRSLNGHTDIVAGCGFTPDGQALLSWSHDGTLRLWDLASIRPLAVLKAQNERIISGDISPDGRWAASGSRDGVISLWDLQAHEERGSLQLGSEVRGCFFLLDAGSLVTAEANGALRLFSAPDMKEQLSLSTQLTIQCGARDPSGSQIALGASDGRIHFVFVDGFDSLPLVAPATPTSRRTATKFQRLLGRSRLIHAFSCTCPVCRHPFELAGNDPPRQIPCPSCRRQLVLHRMAAGNEEK